jgi:site-specific DNA-methyltransferase (adenine-specific)
MNTLFYGDNLDILRGHIADDSVDLVYLDPPFNSARNYNLLFRQRKGDNSPAQIMAFEDTWQYSPAMQEDFRNNRRNTRLFDLMESLYGILGKSEMMAYVLMMAPRLLELHRALKSTGSLYLHCDPVASHYLKIILDVVFGPDKFRNEITWNRSDGHNDAKNQFGRTSDRLLLYVKTYVALFNRQYGGYQDKTLQDWYQYLEFPDGTVRRMTKEERDTQRIPSDARRFNSDNMRSPNLRPN